MYLFFAKIAMSQRWSAMFCATGAWGCKPIGRVRVNLKSGTTSRGNIKDDRYVLLPIPNLKKIYQFTNYFIMGDVISMVLIFLLIFICSWVFALIRDGQFYFFSQKRQETQISKKIFKNMSQEMELCWLYLIKASKNTYVLGFGVRFRC